jgi:IS30 family transposase
MKFKIGTTIQIKQGKHIELYLAETGVLYIKRTTGSLATSISVLIGEKTNDDTVILTIVERKTTNAIVREISSKTADAVMSELTNLRQLFGDKFSTVFKTITGDNGSEFADLSNLENEVDTKVYYTHPYSSFEKGTNERHNGLIRRFIPKGKRISDYPIETLAFIEEWMNTLPRRILSYKKPEELFEEELDLIYSIH